MMATNSILTRTQEIYNQLVDKDPDLLHSLLASTLQNLVEEEAAVRIGAGDMSGRWIVRPVEMESVESEFIQE